MSDYYPAGVTAKMIDDLYRTAVCKCCGYDLDRDGDCAKCAHEDYLYDSEVDA